MLATTPASDAAASAVPARQGKPQEPVVMVGGFPPPMNGAAKNNLALSQLIAERGIEVIRFDTSGPTTSHARKGSYYLQRIYKNLQAAVGVCRSRATASFYTVPDGGLGILYSTVVVALASLRFPRMVIHHRTYSYIDRSSPLMRTIVALTKKKSLHVFLSPSMKQGFEKQYGAVKSLVASNAYFLPEQLPAAALQPPAGGARTIGHLSNLCAEKGFYDVADTFEELAKRSPDIRLAIAGPIVESGVETRLSDLKAKYGERVFHAGPLNADKKFDFIAGVDVFLFPTRYRLEAEPNVVLEALFCGVPVVAFDRGAMRDIVGTQDGFVVGVDDNFAIEAANWISNLFATADPGLRAEIIERTQAKIAAAAKAYEGLFAYFSGRG